MTGFKRLDGASFFRVGSGLSGFIILWWKIQKGRFSYDRLRCSSVQRAFECRIRKVKKASIRSPDVRLSAKQDGILTAIQLLEQAEKRKRGRASAIRRKLIDAGMFTEDGKPAAKVTMQVPDWLGDFDPEAGRLV